MEANDAALSTLARQLPRSTVRLLAKHVHSVGELELLLLLEQDRARAWSVDEICRRLRCPQSWAEPRLDAMTRDRLLAADGGRYASAPASSELDEALRALEQSHRTRPQALTALIVSPSRRRRAFADVLAEPRR
jgi:hypothetical protein